MTSFYSHDIFGFYFGGLSNRIVKTNIYSLETRAVYISGCIYKSLSPYIGYIVQSHKFSWLKNVINVL